MCPGPSDIKWLVPWHPISDATLEAKMADELYREVGMGHVLCGIWVHAVGHRQDCDDVLFELLDGSGRFAVVHLTYAQHPEPDPRWPGTEIYEDWVAFERERMRADAEEWAR